MPPTREDRIARRLVTCKHFTGVQNHYCKAGITYDSVRATHDSRVCWPCIPGGTALLNCPRREHPTLTEVRREEDEFQKEIDRLMSARRAIAEHSAGRRNVSGEVECPICHGRLAYSVASNGHAWARCGTDSCIAFIE